MEQTFEITSAELFVLMKTMKATKILGFSYEEFERAGLAKKEASSKEAENSLISKRYLIPSSESDPQVSLTVKSALTACINPQVTLGMDVNVPGSLPVKYFYHIADNTFVLHSLDQENNTFTLLADKNDLVESVMLRLQIPALAQASDQSGLVEDGVLRQVGQVAGDNLQKAVDLLSKSLPVDMAQSLAQAFAKPVNNTAILRYFTFPGKKVETAGLALLVGETSVWDLIPQFLPNGKSNSMLLVKSTSSNEVKEKINSLLTVNS